VIDLGRRDQYGKLVTSLALIPTDAPPIKAKATGRNQQLALAALKEWCRGNPDTLHIASLAIRELLKAQGISHKRCPEMLKYLVDIRVLTASIAGYTLDPEMLP